MATPKKEADGTWSIRPSWTDSAGIHHSKYKKGFKNANLAAAWEVEFLKKIQTGDITGKRLRLNDVIPLVIEQKTLLGRQDRTIADFILYANLFVSEIGNVYIDTVTPTQIQVILKKYKDTPSKCTHLSIGISQIFSFAFKKNLIESNPYLRVDKPSKPKSHVKPCKEQDLRILLNAAKKDYPIYYPVFLLASICGLRPAESLAVEEQSITPEYLHVVQSVCILSARENEFLGRERKATEYIKKPKSESGIRSIPITPEFYKELHYTKDLFKIESTWLCCNMLGKRLTYNQVHEALKRICPKYGINHATLYQMRHYFGNANKRNGVDRYTTATLMGHSDPSVTEKFYYAEDDQLNRMATNKVIGNFFDNRQQQ